LWGRVKRGNWYFYQLGEALPTIALNGDELVPAARVATNIGWHSWLPACVRCVTTIRQARAAFGIAENAKVHTISFQQMDWSPIFSGM